MPIATAAYAGLAQAGAPLLRLWLRRRAGRGREIPERLAERRGIEASPRPSGRLLWLHAASVGESLSVLPILPHLVPNATVLLTTGTVTSAALLARRLPEAGLADHVIHRFAPLDVPSWVARFLDHWRPDAAGLVESEIWPNLLAACGARQIPTILVNGRLSPRSAARWRRLGAPATSVFGRLDTVLAQSLEDARRFAELGAHNAVCLGNLKFAAAELPVDPAELARLAALLAGRPVWTAAQTHPGEEAVIVSVHNQLAVSHPGLLTILVPRHPERGPSLAAQHATLRRALGQDPPVHAGVWLMDTLGELGLAYRLGEMAFVGRSLLPPGGGQNPLEPARIGRPVAVGPHTDNFREAIALLRDAGALTVAADAASLAAWADAMLRNPARRAEAGEAGRAAAAGFANLPKQVAARLLAAMRP